MIKTTVIPFRKFMDGGYKNKRESDITATTGSLIMILPKAAFATPITSTLGNIHGAIMNAFDAGVVLVIIFSGAS
ncbi:hypothetical protein PDJ95_28800 [Bacillus cereus]|nr:hypothetical protein [Bacillus cereus]